MGGQEFAVNAKGFEMYSQFALVLSLLPAQVGVRGDEETEQSCPGKRRRNQVAGRGLRQVLLLKQDHRLIFKACFPRAGRAWLAGLPAAALHPYPEFLVSCTFFQAFLRLPLGILCL